MVDGHKRSMLGYEVVRLFAAQAERGIAHLDVKADNILVSKAGALPKGQCHRFQASRLPGGATACRMRKQTGAAQRAPLILLQICPASQLPLTKSLSALPPFQGEL